MPTRSTPVDERHQRVWRRLFNLLWQNNNIDGTDTEEDVSKGIKRKRGGFHGYPCPHCGAGVGYNAKNCKACGKPVSKAKAKAAVKEALKKGATRAKPQAKLQSKPQARGASQAKGTSHSHRGSHSALQSPLSIVVPPLSAAADRPSKRQRRASAASSSSSAAATERGGSYGRGVATGGRGNSGGGSGGYGAGRLTDADADTVPYMAQARPRVSAAATASAATATRTKSAASKGKGRSRATGASTRRITGEGSNALVLSPLECADVTQVETHVRALRVAAASRHLLPLLQRMLHHSLNKGVFNDEVDPVALNIPDYHKIIRHPMDLGTVKQKLLASLYKHDREFANDVRLVFANAIRYNPPAHFLHGVAKQMASEFEMEFAKVVDRRQLKRQQERAHECSLCQGHTCPLCGEKCLKFDPPVLHCAGTCNQTIRRSALYHSAPDGLRHWCQRCYNSLPAVVPLPLVTKGQGSVTELRKRDLQRMRCDEEVAEPWVQCDSCERWVHQICALFNLRKQSHLAMEGHGDLEFRCALCCAGENSLDAAQAVEDEDEEAELKPGAAAIDTSRRVRGGKGRPVRMASPRASAAASRKGSPREPSAHAKGHAHMVAKGFAKGASKAAVQGALLGGRKGSPRAPAPEICLAPDTPMPPELVEAKLKPAEPIDGLPPDMCAAALPGSVMGDFIEDCVCRRLHALGEGAMASAVSVRVVSNIDRTVQVRVRHALLLFAPAMCDAFSAPYLSAHSRPPPLAFAAPFSNQIRCIRWCARTLPAAACATQRSSATAPKVSSCSKRLTVSTLRCSRCTCRNVAVTVRRRISGWSTSPTSTRSAISVRAARARRFTTRSWRATSSTPARGDSAPRTSGRARRTAAEVSSFGATHCTSGTQARSGSATGKWEQKQPAHQLLFWSAVQLCECWTNPVPLLPRRCSGIGRCLPTQRLKGASWACRTCTTHTSGRSIRFPRTLMAIFGPPRWSALA